MDPSKKPGASPTPGTAPKPVTASKPPWLRCRIPGGEGWRQVSRTLEKYRLHTVCDGAQCPNKGECWGARTATFMILGDICTRSCRFCAVPHARQGRPPDPGEGERLAAAVEELALAYVVLTSVDRDDLPDRGAGHYAACIRSIRDRLPGLGLEVLSPDYTEAELRPIAAAAPSVLAHNVETVRSLQGVRDRRASFDKSLETLRAAKSLGVPLTKSSILLGLGEKEEEVLAAMDELQAAAVDILVLGQYLRPSPAQIPPVEYLHPDAFSRYGEEARRRGFSQVVSAPLARTSYHAQEVHENLLGGESPPWLRPSGPPPPPSTGAPPP